MDCSDCGSPTVAFALPEDLRSFAPGTGSHAALCTTCLRVHPAAAGEESPTFDRVVEAFPDGEGGVALALLLGKLDSLALNRADVEALVERAEREGADVHLALDRLALSGAVEPHFDLDRRRTQLDQLRDG